MGVLLECEGRALVSKALANDLRLDTGAQRDRCMGMAEVVAVLMYRRM